MTSRKRKFQWLEKEYLWILERTCQRCGVTYTERDNIAAWKCWFHPRTLQHTYDKYGHPIGTFTCCGGRSRSKGCTAIDHSDGKYTTDKNTLMQHGVDPLKLSQAAQKRLWGDNDDNDANYKKIFFRPGMRKKDNDKYLLCPYNSSVAKTRQCGFLKCVSFGIKLATDVVEILTLTLSTVDTDCKDGLKTIPLFKRYPMYDLGDLMLLDEEGVHYKYIKYKDGNQNISPIDVNGKWKFMDTSFTKEIIRNNQSFDDVILYVLKNRHSLADPKIAFFSMSDNTTNALFPGVSENATEALLTGVFKEIESPAATPSTKPIPTLYSSEHSTKLQLKIKNSSIQFAVKRHATLEELEAKMRQHIPEPNEVLFVNPFNSSACTMESLCGTLFPKLKTLPTSLSLEMVQLN